MNTEEVVNHDICPKYGTWSSRFALPRVPVAHALYHSLRAGLIAGRGDKARETLLEIAADPGLDIIAPNVYDIAIHHAALMEVVAAYLTAEGPWKPSGVVDGFELESFLLPDGRLRRVVLCSTWSTLREQEERTSWRTMADVSISNRPMLINFITIGQSIKGFRATPWTRGYIHPENHILRVKRIASEKTGPNPRFTDNWKKVYREQTDHHPDSWLKIMQDDEAFDGLVQHCTVDVPANRSDILADLTRLEREIETGSLTMRRAGCFKLSPCPMASLCHRPGNMTPESSGWKRKPVVR